MVALGLLSHLPARVLAPLSVVVIALHNLADPIAFGGSGWWMILHQPGVIYSGHDVVIILAYPLIPWIAVMAAGFCFGNILVMDPDSREKWLVRTGLALTVAFLVIRAINVYGDPQPRSNDVHPVLSFLRTTKYPPSLDFLLMTLGPALLLLALFYRINLPKTNPLVVIGRVPLFYFLGHFFLLHLLTLPFAWIAYGRAGFLLNPLPSLGGPANEFPPNYGYNLGIVYFAWILVVLLMYPLCLWFARLKQRNRSAWLTYL